MNTLLWVVAGVALFWVVAGALKARGILPDRVRVYGPLLTLHTDRGRDLLNWMARPKRLWRAWGSFGLGVALVVMLGSILFLALVAMLTVLNPPEPTAVNQPRNVLVIPGVNEFLPLSVAPEIILGLAIGLVVHEGGHGILCRVEDIDIESLGLVFLTILPAGAFVEQDEESALAASRGARGRMLAAGVTNNFAVTILAFLLLFGPVMGSVSIVAGATIGGSLDGSPAATNGIGNGDVITGIDGAPIDSNDALQTTLQSTTAPAVEVTLDSGDTHQIQREVLVIGGVTDGPAALAVNDTVVSVNGIDVTTTAGLYAAFANHTIATVTTADGETTTFPAGAYVVVSDGGPLNDTGAPTGPLVVTRLDGDRIVSMRDLTTALASTTPGQTVTLETYDDGAQRTYNVTLGEADDGTGLLGVFTSATGVTGIRYNDLGVQTYPAANYLCALGGSCAQAPDFQLSTVDRVWLALQFPLVGITGSAVFPFNFAGFAGGVANFYTAPVFVLLLANLLFWTAWVNLNLGVFNCVPTFALDGGHILRTAIESVVAYLPIEDGERVVTAATLAVQLTMLASLLLLLFGAQLLN